MVVWFTRLLADFTFIVLVVYLVNLALSMLVWIGLVFGFKLSGFCFGCAIIVTLAGLCLGVGFIVYADDGVC